MSVIDFPDNPAIGDTHTVGGVTWQWDGERWLLLLISDGGSVDLDITGTIYQANIPPTAGISPGAEWANQNLLPVPMKAGQVAVAVMDVRYSLQTAGQGPQMILTVAGGAEIGVNRPGPQQTGDFGWHSQVVAVWRAPSDGTWNFGYRLTEWWGSNWTVHSGSQIRVTVTDPLTVPGGGGGVPAGGARHQVLAKASANDRDVAWATIPFVQSETIVMTTDASGDFIWVYPEPFANAYPIVLCNQAGGASNGRALVQSIDPSARSATQARFRVFDSVDGTILPNRMMRFDLIAVGARVTT